MTPTDAAPDTEAGRAWLDAIQPRGSLLEWRETRNGILAIEAEARADAITGLDEALFAVGGLTFRLDAMRGAAKAVLAYGAEPPEYPGLVLVPKADLDLLRKVTEAPK